MVYVAAGFKRMGWHAVDHCDYCRALDKTVINMDEYFLRAGDEYQPDGVSQPFAVKHDLGHPPLCNGCECLVVVER
jgi:hypothetical protein